MKIAIISPYHGGSHKAWAEGYKQNSRKEVDILALPSRFWKWRMHGGAITLAREYLKVYEDNHPDLLLATDMVDLTTFLSMIRRHSPKIPVVLYVHENQLTYPLPIDGTTGPMRRQAGERDLHYAFVNYVSMLVADRVFFNSHFHKDSFFETLLSYLKHFPDYRELSTATELYDKSAVLEVGVDLVRFDLNRPKHRPHMPPLILWNQRGEYDKNPEQFFAALYTMKSEGLAFRLALCGQNYRRRPSEFNEAIDILADHIIHAGYADDDSYANLLWQADVTISCANHEFFGISMVEAMYCNTFPILPKRLSYPEILPRPFHGRCMYEENDELIGHLRWALTHPVAAHTVSLEISKYMSRYDWLEVGNRYDSELELLTKK